MINADESSLRASRRSPSSPWPPPWAASLRVPRYARQPPSAGRDLEHPKGLCASLHGFSLHAATTARADDAVGREALCKYILRPPIARENIRLVADDLVRLRLKRPFSNDTFV